MFRQGLLNRISVRLALLVSMLTLGNLACFCQVDQGRFVGHIEDPQGSAIVNARVIATNLDTNITQAATTDENGDYVITPVLAGNYTLGVTADTFERVVTKRIEVQVAQIVRQNFILRIGSTNETIQVDTTAPLLGTDSATVGQVITNKQLTELPINGRGFFRLASLTPGAALLPPTGNSLAIRPEVVNGNVISGIRGSGTSFLLDGMDVSEQHQGGTFIQTSIDALQEFSVQQSPYSAEFNRGGAFFNATTKAGTNRFHGGLFEFFRNEKLDARNYFSLNRAILKRNQFGGSLGGPILIPKIYNGHDRTFFFFNYEGQRLRTGLPVNIIVPSDAQRAGNFGSKTIRDPRTNLPFANNTIPRDRLSAPALAIQEYIPHQNTATGTFSATPSQAIDWDQYTVRIDHQITPSNRLFARWVYVNNREVDPNNSPALGLANLTSIGQDIAAGLITNIGSTMVNEIRSHYLPSHVRLQAFLQGPDFNAKFGIAGFSETLRNGQGSFPDYSWSGYSPIQGSTFDQRPKSQDRKAWEISDNFTILKGKQSIKFGTLIRYYQWLGYDSQIYAGSFGFSGSATGDAYADFLLGLPNTSSRAFPAQNFGGQNWSKQFYFQDDIRFGRTTLNLGLRYEYTPWLSGYKGQIGTFDPTQAKPIIVSGSGTVPDLSAQPAAPTAYQFFGQYIQTTSQAGLPSNATYTDKTQFAPRLGLTHSINDKTVIRAGFGMFYEPEGTSGRVNLNTLPFRLSETVAQTQYVNNPRTLSDYYQGSKLGSATANPTLVPTRVRLDMGTNIHYSLNIQRQFTNNDVFEIGYVGNRGVHLNATNDINIPQPTTGTSSVQSRRPYPIWGNITYNTQDMSNHYDSLQTKFEHRFSKGFNTLVAYTYSKSLQYNQASALGGNGAYEYALAPYDTPHNLAMSGSFDLPFGRGRHFANSSSGFIDSVIGGWQLQGIVIFRSGTPYTPTVSGDVARTGVGNQRPNLNPNGGNPNFKRSLAKWFDTSRYVVAPIGTYGNVRANTLRSDMFRQFDASIFKNFNLPRESVLSFRAEFFNVSNTTSFNAPNVFNNTSFGTQVAPIDTTSGAQISSTSVNPRSIQFALKYRF